METQPSLEPGPTRRFTFSHAGPARDPPRLPLARPAHPLRSPRPVQLASARVNALAQPSTLAQPRRPHAPLTPAALPGPRVSFAPFLAQRPRSSRHFSRRDFPTPGMHAQVTTVAL